MLHFSVCDHWHDACGHLYILVVLDLFLLQGAASNFVELLMFNDNKKDSDFPF